LTVFSIPFFQCRLAMCYKYSSKKMIPSIVGQFIVIFKGSFIALVIGVLELNFVARMPNNRLMVYPFAIYTSAAVLYFLCCRLMSIFACRLVFRLSHEKFLLNLSAGSV
jgi:polar amino acid transport system permease protein